MYFRWKDRRIVVKIALWAGVEGRARSTLDGLAQHLRQLVDAGEADPPHEGQSAGLARNADPVEIDEEERAFSLYFCHPPGEAGRFGGFPVDYKCFAPEAPVEGNRAFEEALRDASGVLLLGENDLEHHEFDEASLQALEHFLNEREGGARPLREHVGSPEGLSLRVALDRGEDGSSPEEWRERLECPEPVPVETRDLDAPESIYESFVELARQMRPRLERAREQRRIPTD